MSLLVFLTGILTLSWTLIFYDKFSKTHTIEVILISDFPCIYTRYTQTVHNFGEIDRNLADCGVNT